MLNYFKAKLSTIKRVLNPYTYFASRQNVCDVMELVDLEVTKKLGQAYWRSEDCWKLIADLRLRYEQDIHQLQQKIIWLKSENTKVKNKISSFGSSKKDEQLIKLVETMDKKEKEMRLLLEEINDCVRYFESEKIKFNKRMDENANDMIQKYIKAMDIQGKKAVNDLTKIVADFKDESVQ